MPRPLEDLIGRTYGSWTVLRRGPHRRNETVWTCRCICGSEADIPKSNLTRGLSTQCTACRDKAREKPPKPRRSRATLRGVKGPAHPRWRGNLIVYASAHKRVVAERGKASTHACVDCGEPANDWSREKIACETRMVDAKGPYCTHSEHYSPRCRSCHNAFDH